MPGERYNGRPCICGMCNRAGNFQYVTRFGHLPPVLVINFKRFAGSAGDKIDGVVHFPETQLTLKSDEEGELRYDLVSVVCHNGSASSGHYMAYCKYGKTWYFMNDEMVISLGNIQSCQTNAYILFYRCVNYPAKKTKNGTMTVTSAGRPFMLYSPTQPTLYVTGGKSRSMAKSYEQILMSETSKKASLTGWWKSWSQKRWEKRKKLIQGSDSVVVDMSEDEEDGEITDMFSRRG